MSNDILREDPHGVVPVGFNFRGQYEVVGFCDPAGQEVLHLMVCIRYPDYVENGWGFSTTREYITVLRDYLSGVDYLEELLPNISRWRDRQLMQYAEAHPELSWCRSHVAMAKRNAESSGV